MYWYMYICIDICIYILIYVYKYICQTYLDQIYLITIINIATYPPQYYHYHHRYTSSGLQNLLKITKIPHIHPLPPPPPPISHLSNHKDSISPETTSTFTDSTRPSSTAEGETTKKERVSVLLKELIKTIMKLSWSSAMLCPSSQQGPYPWLWNSLAQQVILTSRICR